MSHVNDRVLRFAVRVILIDSTGAVLLLSTRDASNADFGTSWELPGGGINTGESIQQAAVREVAEETGFLVSIADIGPPLWRREVLYTYRCERRLQHEVICMAGVTGVNPPIDIAGREPIELEDHERCRWWLVEDIKSSADRFYPRSLPRHIEGLIAGYTIDEPFETWEE